MEKTIYDSIIIGAGPAGLTAAIYLARSDFKVLVIEKNAPGGKLLKTSEVENYTGFKKIAGVDLAIEMYNHALKFKTPFKFEAVTSVKKDKNIFTVKTNKAEYMSKTVIVATGTEENKIGAKNEDKFYAKGVSYCAVCDGALYKQKEVAVVGGGYSAVEEAMYLTNFVNKVYLIHRQQKFRVTGKILQNAKNNPKIHFILDSIVTDINGDDLVNSITIKNVLTNEIQNLKISAIFPYVGAKPVNNFLTNITVLNEQGYIKKNTKCETTIAGLFAAGDVTDTSLRQIATAVSDGAVASQFIISYLNNL